MGDSKELGKFVVLQDAYGNRYTYAHLGVVSKLHPVPRQNTLSAKDFRLTNPNKDTAPTAPASAGDNSAARNTAMSATSCRSSSRWRRRRGAIRRRCP